MKTESWVDIAGYESRYQVSTFGNVRSLDFRDSLGRLRKGRVLKVQTDRCGYARVRLSLKDVKESFRVHRLVASAFLSNPKSKRTVNHKDGVKINNEVSNLEWATDSENINHAITAGLLTYTCGSSSHAFKAPTEVYNLKGEYLYSLCGNAALEEKGFDYRLVSDVILGKRKSHKQHIFKRRII